MRGETAFREGSPGLPSRRWETRRSQTATRARGSSLRSLHSPPLSCAAPVPTGTAAPLLAVKGCRAPSSHRASTLLAHSARQQRRGRLLTACLCSCAVQRTRAPLRSCRDPASWPSLAQPTPPSTASSATPPGSPKADEWRARTLLRPLSHTPPRRRGCWSDFQAVWCRDGRERDDFLLRQRDVAAELLRSRQGGKPTPGNAIPASESRSEHALMVLMLTPRASVLLP